MTHNERGSVFAWIWQLPEDSKRTAELRARMSKTVAPEISLTNWVVGSEPARAIRNSRRVRHDTLVALPHCSAIELDCQSVKGINRAFIQRLYPNPRCWRKPVEPRSEGYTGFRDNVHIPFVLRNESRSAFEARRATLYTSIRPREIDGWLSRSVHRRQR